MPSIKLKRHTPPVGREYEATSYPGIGAYLTPIGIIFVLPDNLTWVVNMNNWQNFVQENDAAGNIDVHRLFDQMIELRK